MAFGELDLGMYLPWGLSPHLFCFPLHPSPWN